MHNHIEESSNNSYSIVLAVEDNRLFLPDQGETAENSAVFCPVLFKIEKKGCFSTSFSKVFCLLNCNQDLCLSLLWF